MKSVVGILAHVDAGKTTLSESMLYLAGNIRKQGRVDHKDSFLDYDHQERDRGITIYSKPYQLKYEDLELTFIDTPGHTDFSAEMERALSVLDYAIVVVSALDGIQSHTETIFKLLDHYHIPSFIFVNKMDYQLYSKEDLLDRLIQFDDRCFDAINIEDYLETIALSNESSMNEYLETETLSVSTLSQLISKQHIIPVYFGSALKNTGVKELLEALKTYMLEKEYPKDTNIKCFKMITENKQRLTFVKVTGGQLNVKEMIHEEKIDQIRVYNGSKYEVVQSAPSGSVVALLGLNELKPGETLNDEMSKSPVLRPYLSYHIILPDDCNTIEMTQNILRLKDEDPTMNIQSDESGLSISLMGEIQIQILHTMILDRYGIDVSFDAGVIQYMETITDAVEGVGHFEPLRHYAEVHLLMEPLTEGEGIIVEYDNRTTLQPHFMRLIKKHILEVSHKGVVGGYPITDIKFTILGGKSHLKHTEGGDFREATYRAIRHGLMRANSKIIEPYYHFELTVPASSMSKAIYDLDSFEAKFEVKEVSEDVYITGSGSVSCMRNYIKDVMNYTKGKGKLDVVYDGYKEVKNVKALNNRYDPITDLNHPVGSVFCKHGAGFYVPYEEVEDYMHLPYLSVEKVKTEKTTYYHDDDLEAIFERTYGKIERRLSDEMTYHKHMEKIQEIKAMKKECLLVDGYNVIHAWDELSAIMDESLDAARERLLDILGNYQGYKQNVIIVVFDAYKVKGNVGSESKIHNLYVVYTKEAQTADAYIERVTRELADTYNVIVATSDALEQTIILGHGARRISSRELKLEVENLIQTKKEEYERNKDVSRNFLLEEIKNFKGE